MRIHKAQLEFKARYYEWAKADFRREILAGFPFLSYFKSGPPWTARQLLQEMVPSERSVLALALLKRFHKEASEAAGERPSKEDEKILGSYRARILELSPHENLLTKRLHLREPKVRASRTTIRKLIRQRLQQSRGEVAEDAVGVWKHWTSFGSWALVTHIITSHKYADFLYMHDILFRSNGESVFLSKTPIFLHRFISFNSWLGLSSQTDWSDLTRGQEEVTVGHFWNLYKHFLKNLPPLLDGLET